jgi:hypothetical protein
MHCISRYTDDTYAQQFGDGRHKFYLEFRCNRPCLKNMNTCAKCYEKSYTTLQHSRKFNHGNINQPIPDNSHIFGGKWYYDGIRKWGEPPSEIIEFALQYQKEARGDVIMEESDINELYKSEKESSSQEMPRIKKDNENNVPAKRTKKPKIAPDNVNENASIINDTNKPVKRTRKPKVAPESNSTLEPKKTVSRKKPVETPYSTLVNNTNQLVHKEVSVPTHIETHLEQIDSEGYQIEYIKLALFEANGTTYYRDSKKNKLYTKVKDKRIGSYVGRWNPDTDSIMTNIPDSDDEE